MSDSHELSRVERITVGAVGPAGSRVFMLQARQGGELVTLKVEKSQVAALAEYLADILEELGRPGELPTELELEMPAEPGWVVGTLGVSYDQESEMVVLVAEEATDEDDIGAVARFSATLEQVAALAIRGTSLVQSGRPPCPLCGYPLDPRGHNCPRTNGHRPPRL
jgi:uncharacterized repeat protein (TIGR03847 family)